MKPPKVTPQFKVQAEKELDKLGDLAREAGPVLDKVTKTANQIGQLDKKIQEKNDQLKVARKAANEKQIKDLKEAKEKLEARRFEVNLEYTSSMQKGVWGSMRDRCQGLANNPAINGDTLSQNCGKWFDKRDPFLQELMQLNKGVIPVKVPDWRIGDRILSPFPAGSVQPGTGGTSPYFQGGEQGPGVPPVGPAGPLPGQE